MKERNRLAFGLFLPKRNADFSYPDPIQHGQMALQVRGLPHVHACLCLGFADQVEGPKNDRSLTSFLIKLDVKYLCPEPARIFDYTMAEIVKTETYLKPLLTGFGPILQNDQ